MKILENDFERIQRWKHEKEEIKRQKIEADLVQERMLEEIIAEIKWNVSNKHIFIERIKGYVSLEEDPSVDYILDCVFDDISLKSLKNENNRLAPE